MKRILFLLTLLCLEKTLHAQYVYTIKADSVKITNTCDTAELIIENHTQNVPGFLFNKGRGRTEFRRVISISDSSLVFGGDTLVIRGSVNANNGVSMAGKTVQLGQSIETAGNPAALFSNREIPMNGFDIRLTNINDAGCLKLYSSSNKTTTSPFIQFLDPYGGELGRISFFDTANSANLMIGRKAGWLQGPGAIRNTFIGSESGMSVTSGSRNTGIGHRTLMSATTGSANIAIGGYALEFLTSGYGNFAMGYTAATSLTTGINNICIGGSQLEVSAIQNLQTGNNNIAIGIGALAEASVPTSNFSDNIALGYRCFYQNTAGNRNIGIGNTLCLNSLVGIDNILLGSNSISAGSNVGNRNVILSTNLSSTGGSIGDNNIILGSNFTTTSSLTNTVIVGQGITNNQNNVVRLGRADQNIIIGATSNQTDNGDRIQILGTAYITDTLKLPNIFPQSDTGNYKQMVVDANGNVFKMNSWTGTGARKSATITTSTYTVPADIDVVFVNYTGGTATVTLPSGTPDREITIKNLNTTNSVALSGLDASESNTVATRGAITVKYTGSAWVGISKY